MCKVSDKSEMVGEIIEWFDMELPCGNGLVGGQRCALRYTIFYQAHCVVIEVFWKLAIGFTTIANAFRRLNFQ